MKKLFAILTISALSFCAIFGMNRQSSFVYAENETSQVDTSSQPQSSSSESESSSEELEPIDIDKEISGISQTAKDVVEVVKTILNQPIVIGGTTFTLGMLFCWLFGKVLLSIMSKRNTKYDKKIEEVLKKIGVNQEMIDWLKENADTLNEVIKEMINSEKNIKVKEKLLELYNNKDNVKNEVIEQIEEQVEDATNGAQDKIKELLEK